MLPPLMPMHQETSPNTVQPPREEREEEAFVSSSSPLLQTSPSVCVCVCVPLKESKDLTSYYCVPPTIQISASFTSSDSPIIDVRSEKERLLSSVSIPQLIA